MGCLGTGIQHTFINSGPIGASPISGVVVRFRVRAGTFGANGLAPELRIVQPAGGGLYTGAIGVDIPCNSDFASQQHLQLGTSTGAAVLGFSPELTDGGSPRSATTTSLGANTAVLVSADVEPHADRDGFGDGTQDQSPTNATTQGPCPQPAVAPSTWQGQARDVTGTEGNDRVNGTAAAT